MGRTQIINIGEKMKRRLKEIAEEVGVSMSTVSRAINPSTRDKVAPATLKRIDELVEQCGYSPNEAARSLRKTKTKTIGIVLPAYQGLFHNSIFTDVLAGVSDCIMETDYTFKLILLKDSKKKWTECDFKSSEGVDGLVVTQWAHLFSGEINPQFKMPAVFINDYEPKINAYFVCSDGFIGGHKVAEYLYSLGHTKLGVITGPEWSSDSVVRLDGFRSYLRNKELDVDPRAIIDGGYLEEKAYNVTEELIDRNPNITAIFCCNDEMAFGVLRRLKEMGKSCPGDISVVGYDNLYRSLLSEPRLTTVGDPIYGMAAQGTKALIDYLEGDKKEPFVGKKFFCGELIERESTDSME